MRRANSESDLQRTADFPRRSPAVRYRRGLSLNPSLYHRKALVNAQITEVRTRRKLSGFTTNQS
jgi:hypothetical protein